MLLGSEQKLDDLIIKLLANKPLSALEIQSKLMSEAKEFTLQAIYKVIRVLESSGIIIKSKKRFGLRLPWVLDLSSLAGEAVSVYSKSAELPRAGKRTIWHFNDLQGLNNFWSQILLLAIQNSSSKILFTWMPHPWFHLAYSEQEEQYIKALKLTGSKLYLINGGDTFLDCWAEKYWQKENIEYSNSQSWFHKVYEHQYINVIDDFVLTVKLDKNITGEINHFYKNIKSFDDMDFSEVFRIFGLKVKVSMWLENDERKAQYYRKRFIEYFGIKPNDNSSTKINQ